MSEEEIERNETIRNQLREHRCPEEWCRELGIVDGDTVLLMFWLDQLSRRVRAAHQEEVRRIGLSSTESKLLYHLLLSGPPYRQSPTGLNKHLELTSGGITKAVDRLEGQGLVTRHPDDDDGRSIRVQLTETGVEYARRAAEAFAKRYEELMSPLLPSERKETVQTLRMLLDAFDGPI